MGIGTQDQKCETCQSCDCFYCQLREYPEGAQLLKLAEIVVDLRRALDEGVREEAIGPLFARITEGLRL